MRLGYLAIVTAACGRIGFAPDSIGDAPDASDAADATDAAVTCTTVELFDDFTGTVIDPPWATFATDPGMVLTEEADVARVTLVGVDIPPNTRGGIVDAAPRDYRDRCVAVAITKLPAISSVFSKVFLGTDADHVGIQLNPDGLAAFQRIAGVEEGGPGTIAYDPVAHRLIVIKVSATTLEIGTSAGFGGAFVPLHSYPGSAINPSNAALTIRTQTGLAIVNGMNERFEIDAVEIRK